MSFTKVIQFSEWVVGPFIGEASCWSIRRVFGVVCSPLWLTRVLRSPLGFPGLCRSVGQVEGDKISSLQVRVILVDFPGIFKSGFDPRLV